MAVSDMNSAMESAVASLTAGDYSAAITHAIRAQAYMSALPDSRHGSGEMRWRPSQIEDFINNCRRAQSSSVGIGSTGGVFQQQLVNYANPTELLQY